MSVNQFDQLKINKFLLRALDDMGFEEPTSIQDKVFSSIKAGKDVVGIAQTGTGKTFAYLLPALTNWKFTKSPYPQILILVPTRELVIQVEEEVKKLTEFMSVDVAGVFGGVNMQNHREAVSGRLDVVVGTPGRLMDLILCGALRTKDLKVLIIDEVDEMLNLGFRTQLRNIVELIPEKRQNLMFSATMIPEVEDVIHQFTSFYEKIEAAPSGAPLENIEQLAYLAPNFNSKANLLSYLLKQDEGMKKVLVFAGTRKMADALHKRMNEEFDDQVGVIHSSKAQNNRFNTVNRFADGTYRFIIATDIVARGLDVAGVSHVINFDLPSTSEQYVHRIGRTGRAEERGAAIAFVSEKELAYKASIEELMNFTIPLKEKPEEVDFTDELIGLETEKEHLASDNFYKLDDSGSAFHEKAKKNQKVNTKVRHKDVMHQKYGKPQTRGVKPKGKKKRK
ncbi:MAG: DEAD/DEAH box helicase [Chitinophagales bacterium]|tara:strand:+ start:13756 stop:15108 length:1353 start_codon:yes stop_codon:yes gene_type:complete